MLKNTPCERCVIKKCITFDGDGKHRCHDIKYKAFFALSRNTKSPVSKREGMERTQRSSVLYINNAAVHCIYTQRRGFIVSFIHLLVGVWRCLYSDGLEESNSLRLFCTLMYGVLIKLLRCRSN